MTNATLKKQESAVNNGMRGGSHRLTAGNVTGTPTRVRPGRLNRGRHLLLPIIIQTVAFFGLAALLYPSAANWFADRNHNSEISGYIKSYSSLDTGLQSAKLAEAVAYNAQIPAGMLRDPYAATPSNQAEAVDQAYSAYTELISMPGKDVIGEIKYPRLGVDLPIYHGTSDETISKGAGHLYGSSLPVGGDSTHSLLTAHSGLSTASLFTPVLQARLQDEFQITTLGETKYYRVTDVKTILPEQTGSLGIVPGKDLVTLITCTPLGSNTHRLLVQGERIPAPVAADSTIVIAGDGLVAGFPWWAVIFVGANAALAYILFSGPVRRTHRLNKRQKQQSLSDTGLAKGRSEQK